MIRPIIPGVTPPTHSTLVGYIGWLYDLFTLNEQVDERNRETA